ncbi:MAG: hypothetical protein KID09_14555, partial [Paenibacillus macerans]|uniref:hypothetical protein n=1 Tax=Paenibacillus macerans TaxID=44252 RepID=UPI0024318423
VHLHPIYTEKIMYQLVPIKAFIVIRFESRGPNKVYKLLSWQFIRTHDQLIVRAVEMFNLFGGFNALEYRNCV